MLAAITSGGENYLVRTDFQYPESVEDSTLEPRSSGNYRAKDLDSGRRYCLQYISRATEEASPWRASKCQEEYPDHRACDGATARGGGEGVACARAGTDGFQPGPDLQIIANLPQTRDFIPPQARSLGASVGEVFWTIFPQTMDSVAAQSVAPHHASASWQRGCQRGLQRRMTQERRGMGNERAFPRFAQVGGRLCVTASRRPRRRACHILPLIASRALA